jgi:hypothetical protein
MIKLPKEVLDLFPLWEYCCPVCQTYVEPTVISCPKCLAVFSEEKWRVPPRFLKSRKAMSDYAHEVLAPKLTENQRTLLFKYFTDVFSDGFESGDFSAWTGTVTSSGETCAVETVNPHHGSYNARFGLDGSDYWEDAYVYKTFASSYGVLYARCYMRFENLRDYTEVECLQLRNSVNGKIFAAGYQRWGGDPQWMLGVLESGSMQRYYANSPAIQVGTYYCVELYGKVDGAVGEAKLYVNGNQTLSVADKDTDDFGNMNQLRIGLADSHVSSGNSFVVCVDCVKVADMYVGVEAAGQTYEISVDALANASASNLEQCTLSIAKEASVASQVATLNFELGFPKDALVHAFSLHSEETLYSVFKDVVVKALADPLGQSTFNLSSEAVVKVLAEVSIVKEGEVKVTRLFLVLGDLAIQLQGD